MKKNNLWRIIWIVGIYAVLLVILYLVIMYKVKWEDKDFNRYLYFYNCSNELCTSDIKPDKYYNKIVCENNICPHIKEFNVNYLILDDGNKNWIYDYQNGKIINNNYVQYEYLNNNYYKVVDNDEMVGIIDIEGNIIVNFEYDYIYDFKDNILTYKEDNKYKFLNIETMNQSTNLYDEIILINSKIYGYLEDNNYYIASYDNYNSVNNIKYNYIYSYENVILAIHNKKIEILDSDLKNTLLMNISTFYDYTKESERDSLDIYIDNNLMYFTVVQDNNKYIKYTYDLKNKRLI